MPRTESRDHQTHSDGFPIPHTFINFFRRVFRRPQPTPEPIREVSQIERRTSERLIEYLPTHETYRRDRDRQEVNRYLEEIRFRYLDYFRGDGVDENLLIKKERAVPDKEHSENLRALTPEEMTFIDRFLQNDIFCAYEDWSSIRALLQSDAEGIDLLAFLVSENFRTWAEDVFEYHKQYINKRTTSVPLFSNKEALLYFFQHPNRDLLLGLISSTDLYLMRINTYRLYNRSADVVRFLLNYPEFLLLEAQYGRPSWIESERKMPWSARIEMAERVAEVLGTHGVKDKELSVLIYSLWDPLKDTQSTEVILHQMTLEQKYDLAKMVGIQVPEQADSTTLRTLLDIPTIYAYCENDSQKIRDFFLTMAGDLVYTVFRAGTDLQTRNQLRAAIRDFKSNFGVPLTMSERQKNELDYTESELHPLGPLIPPFGSEIEYAPTKGIGLVPSQYLSHHGFRTGHGGDGAPAEFAAGPFKSSPAAFAALEAMVDSEIFHVHQEIVHTLHANAGINSEVLFAQWIRVMRMTGLPYIPDIERLRKSAPRHSLSIQTHEGQNEPVGRYTPFRVESKDLRFPTMEAYRAFLEIGMPLLSALRAYGKAVDAYRHKHSIRYVYDHEIRMSLDDIKTLPLSAEERRLAGIWRDVLIDFADATESIGCPDSINYSIRTEHALQIAEQINTVYPTSHSRNDASRTGIEIPGGTIYQSGEKYANIVQYSQVRLAKAAQETQGILNHAEAKVLKSLAHYASLTDENEKQRYTQQFFIRFSWHSDIARKREHIENMLAHAIRHGKLQVESGIRK